MTEESVTHRKRLRAPSGSACDRCRKLKMKCQGSPCEACVSSGHDADCRAGKAPVTEPAVVDVLISLVQTQSSCQRLLLDLLSRAQCGPTPSFDEESPVKRLRTACYGTVSIPCLMRRSFPRIQQQILASLQSGSVTESGVVSGMSYFRLALARHCPDLLPHVDTWMTCFHSHRRSRLTAPTSESEQATSAVAASSPLRLPAISSLSPSSPPSPVSAWHSSRVSPLSAGSSADPLAPTSFSPDFTTEDRAGDRDTGLSYVIQAEQGDGQQEHERKNSTTIRDMPMFTTSAQLVDDSLPVATIRVHIPGAKPPVLPYPPCSVHGAAVTLVRENSPSPSSSSAAAAAASPSDQQTRDWRPLSPIGPFDDNFSFHFDDSEPLDLSFPPASTDGPAEQCTCALQKAPVPEVRININHTAQELFGWTAESFLANMHGGHDPFSIRHMDEEHFADFQVAFIHLNMERRPFSRLVTIERSGAPAIRCMLSARSEPHLQVFCFTPVEGPAQP